MVWSVDHNCMDSLRIHGAVVYRTANIYQFVLKSNGDSARYWQQLPCDEDMLRHRLPYVSGPKQDGPDPFSVLSNLILSVG
jgi:hypothetical protein